MRKVQFFGVVHPESGGWYFTQPISTTTRLGGATIHLHESRFIAEVRVPADSPPAGMDLQHWGNAIWYDTQSVLQAALDALGFARGASLEVELTGGSVEGTGLVFPLSSLDTFAEFEDRHIARDGLQPYLKGALTNVNVRHALADMRSALKFTDDAIFYCFRALESCRQEFLDGNPDDGKARSRSWQRLRTELEVSRDWADELTELAKGRRHGGIGAETHSERLKWVRETKEVVARFVRYVDCSSGRNPLAACSNEAEPQG